jgi:hypothetical protein
VGRGKEQIVPGDGLDPTDDAIGQQKYGPPPTDSQKMLPNSIPPHFVEHPEEKNQGEAQEDQGYLTHFEKTNLIFRGVRSWGCKL